MTHLALLIELPGLPTTGRLRLAPQPLAMAAGITDKPLWIREILGWVVPGGRRKRRRQRTLQAVLDRC